MASWEKKPNGKYRVRWREPGTGKQREKSFDTEAEARLYAATREVDIAHGNYIAADQARITIRDYAPRWLASKRRISESTADRYLITLEHNIYPLLGDLPVSQLRAPHIDDLIERLTADGLAAATVQKAVNVVSQICARAVREKVLLANPCVGVDLPQIQRREMLYLTPAELERLCSKMKPDAALFTRFLAYTGLRWGEATALTVADFDPMRRRVRVDKSIDRNGKVGPTKTRNIRWVPLEPALAEDVAALAAASPPGLLFRSSTGRAYHSSNFRRDHWDPAKKKAGIDPALRLHDLRHTCATWLINEGADVYRVMKWMGHTNITTTINTYSHLLPERLDDLAAGLGAVRERKGDGPATVARVEGIR